jgi:aminoglycoside phosphotransferase (APT) family kinase protein
MHGGAGFCLLETMREHSSETSDLLDEVQALTLRHAQSIGPGNDLVHFDFTRANILAEDGRVTGVIDWEAVMRGDRGFDLCTFAFYQWDDAGIREKVLPRALDISGVDAARVYFAHIVLRQVEWTARFYGEPMLSEHLNVSRRILAELGRMSL